MFGDRGLGRKAPGPIPRATAEARPSITSLMAPGYLSRALREPDTRSTCSGLDCAADRP